MITTADASARETGCTDWLSVRFLTTGFQPQSTFAISLCPRDNQESHQSSIGSSMNRLDVLKENIQLSVKRD